MIKDTENPSINELQIQVSLTQKLDNNEQKLFSLKTVSI